MKTLETLEHPATSENTRKILAKDGFECALLTLAPEESVTITDHETAEEHLLFVVDGDVAVRRGEIHTLLNKDAALLLPRGEGCTLKAGAAPAKVLRVAVPPASCRRAGAAYGGIARQPPRM